MALGARSRRFSKAPGISTRARGKERGASQSELSHGTVQQASPRPGAGGVQAKGPGARGPQHRLFPSPRHCLVSLLVSEGTSACLPEHLLLCPSLGEPDASHRKQPVQLPFEE